MIRAIKTHYRKKGQDLIGQLYNTMPNQHTLQAQAHVKFARRVVCVAANIEKLRQI